jgi:glc operon protein GlcG
MSLRNTLLTLAGCFIAAAAGAQDNKPMSPPPVTQSTEAAVIKHSISAHGAGKVLAAAAAMAAKNHWGMSIAVVDESGRLIAFLRMDGAPLGTIDVAQSKAATAIKFKMPTKFVQDLVTKGGPAMLTIPGITALTGGYPIEQQGQIIGAIGVSGGFGDEDDRTAMAGIAALKE